MIGEKLGTEPIIAAYWIILVYLFASGEIVVEDKTTQAIREFTDVVPAEEAGLKGFRIDVYKIKPEFEKCFEVSEEELETERAAEEARMADFLNQISSQTDTEEE